MKVRCGKIVVVILLLMTSLRVLADGVTFHSLPTPKAQEGKQQAFQFGRATYYHKSLHGRRTATGERFDMEAMTAAHRNLKLGSFVRVTNLRNGLRVAARINDRLPPRSRAIIDLSIRAARQLGIYRRGVAKVKLEMISEDEYGRENNRP